MVLALALGGGLLLLLAIERSDPLAGLGGATLATVGAWGATEYSAARWADGAPAMAGRRWWARILTPWRMVIATSLMLAVAALSIAEATRSPVIAFVGLMLLAVGAGPVVHTIHAGSPRHPEVWVGGGLVLAVAGVVVLGSPLTDGAGGRAGIGVGSIALGLLSVGRGLTTYRDTSRLGWALGPAGVGVIAVGAWIDSATLSLTGAIGCLVSLMALSAAAGDDAVDDRTGPSDLAIPAVGALLVVIAGWFVWVSGVAGESVLFLVFLVTALVLTGASIVWRTAVVFGAVVVGFVFVWGITASTVQDRDGVSSRADGDASPGIIALGDSYISGEGATEFYERTDEKGARRNECRRAPTAYPVLVSLGDDGAPRGDGLDPIRGLDRTGIEFLACSGAETRNVVTPPVPPTADEIAGRLERLPCRPTNPDGTVDVDRLFASYPCGPDGVYGSTRQVDALPTDLSATRLALLSIGGNDARFGEVVMGCLVPGTCAERREVWLDQLVALGLELETTYRQVRAALNPTVDRIPVVVMPYPLVMTETRCARSPFQASEHEFVVEFTTALNEQIEAAADRAGVHFFKPGMFALDGHRVCDDAEPAINLIELQPTDGPLFDRLQPGSWTHNSMHPNELGHRLIADALTEWLNDNGIVDAARIGPANPLSDDERGDAADDAVLLGLRSPRTFAIDPATVQALRSARPDGSSCDFTAVETFAARVEVFDEDTDGPAPKIQLRGADPGAVICSTASDGTWRTARPDRTPEDDESTRPEGIAEVSVESDGEVFIRGGRPNESCVEPLDDSRLCRYQWVLFSAAPGDPDATDAEEVAERERGRVWQLRVIDYCTVDPDCPDTIDAWSDRQLEQASLILVPAAVIIAFGGWLLALGLLLNRRRLERHLPPALRPVTSTS